MLDATGLFPCCPRCGMSFEPRRKDQKFCQRACAKAASRNASRGSRSVADSWSERARCRKHNRRAMELAAWLYTTPPAERLGLMQELIEAAREYDAQLRGVLTDPRLLRASPQEPWLFFRRSPGAYKTISQAADAYCRKFWGAGVATVVHRRCPEPPTGEDGDTEGHRPPQMSLHTCNEKTSRVPEGVSYGGIPESICKGFRWLTVSRSEARKLRALGGCPA